MSHKRQEPLRNEIFRKLLIAGPVFIIFIYIVSILFGEEFFSSYFPLIGVLYAVGLFCFFIPTSNRLMESDVLRIKTDQKLILSGIYPTVSVVFMSLVVLFTSQETLLVASIALGALVYCVLILIRDNSELFSILGTIIVNIAWYIVSISLTTVIFRF